MKLFLFYLRVLYWCWVKDGDIIVARDCSGSTTGEQAWRMVDLVNTIIGMFGVDLVRVIDFDTQIRGSHYVCKPLDQVHPMWGGGTLFAPIVKEAERTKAAGLIICSDMYAFDAIDAVINSTVPIMGVLIEQPYCGGMPFRVVPLEDLV